MFVRPVASAIVRTGAAPAYAVSTQLTTPGKIAAAMPEMGAGYRAATTDGSSGKRKSMALNTPCDIGTSAKTALVATSAADTVQEIGPLTAPFACGADPRKS